MRPVASVLALLVGVLTLVVPAVSAQDAQDAQDARLEWLTAEQRAWLDDNGPLRVGYARPTAPVVVVDESDAVAGGWMVELVQLAALKLGIDIVPVLRESVPDLVAALEAGEVDVIAGVSTRPDLRAFAEPTTPWSWTPVVLMVGEDVSGVDGLRDMAGRRVTTIPGSPIEEHLVDDFPDIDYVVSDSIPDGLGRVASGDVEGFVGPLAIVGYQLRDTDVRLFPVGEPIDIVEVGVWGLPDSPALGIMQAGRDLITDTELSVIHVRWTGFDLGEPGGDGLSPWVLRAVLIALAGIVLLVVFIVVLRRQVERATSDLRDLSAELEDRVARRTTELAMVNAELGRSNGRLADFANTVAHDLRGPVTAITGMAEMLADGSMPADRSEVAMEMIRDSTMRLNTMISDLLGRARNSAIDEVVTLADFRLWLEDLTAAELHRAGATLAVVSDLEDDTVLAVDLAVLRHAVANLVGNAVKYGVNPDGARIEVSVHCIEGTLSVTVADNGPGIAPELRERIFDPGFQADDAAPGLGLGLPAVREALRACGGSIEVGEAPGGGTAMHVLLPRLERDEAPTG